MAAPLLGECREHLHALPLLQPGEQGLACVGWFTGYPPLAGNFPACGRYEAREPEKSLAAVNTAFQMG
jgi:hypothetical protein